MMCVQPIPQKTIEWTDEHTDGGYTGVVLMLWTGQHVARVNVTWMALFCIMCVCYLSVISSEQAGLQRVMYYNSGISDMPRLLAAVPHPRQPSRPTVIRQRQRGL